MHSTLPKVLHPLAGKPLISHVLTTARALLPGKICVVYGHGGELVPQLINDDELIWVKQDPQMGTGHALMQTLPHLDHDGVTLVLYGDVPLTSVETLKELVAISAERTLALLTLELDDPSGYGRIVRSSGGKEVIAIVEEKDASKSEQQIREINTGIMVAPNQFLHNWLPKLENKNSQKEYYLTDIVKIAVADRVKVEATHPEYSWETLGINSKVQLAALERIYQDETAGRLLDQGVTLADPSRIDIRGQLICGSDVSIDINCIFEGSVQLGDNVRVGANCILKNTKVLAGTQIAPFSLIEDAEIGKDCRIGPYARIRPGTLLSD